MTGLLPARDGDAALAGRFGLPLLQAIPAAGHYLTVEDGALALAEVGERGRVVVDFVGGAQGHRRKFGGGRGQPVARAVGLKPDYQPSVLDATAGLARDGFVLASLGCALTLLERSPVACALVADGLARALAAPETAAIAARMQLVHADALHWLQQTAEHWDVVYLDPMFPEPGKRAKSKKDMAAFQTLIGGDADADALLAPARRLATRRVVVKRPRHAPWLAGEKPAFAYEGDSTRFDVYLPVAVSA
ncbi:class I SAM-dependent methyltransferase [Chitiniphilus eburneus]|uniref:Ribosomal RNA small subunit methyltransferase J n=1 Tax=Chitiniphilus eburneus TaxID=2571148 RepID=A0A4U0PXN2_9NEIS|nr:class I SAM-dependent methyltransferase [Chitiniphilus eburneus]TJZ73351.1 16S rRNA methyltransferase [Chitiniphilus eburneus]